MWDFPQDWVVGRLIARRIDQAVDWMVASWDPFFDAVNQGVLWIVLRFERFLLWLPWWVVVLLVAGAGWRLAGRRFAGVGAGLMLLMGFLGLWDPAMTTLALVLTATALSVAVGLPLGILAARSDRFDALLRPVLDGMQTMPSFVYLIPAIMLLGLGKTPAVMATVIYAVPPIIRLTNLGIRQVDRSVMEAALSFGATSWQLLRKVQIPLALPTIMAGLNQTLMMALAMMVVASLIGAKGLGVEVLIGINRLEIGRGFLAGLGIVFLAIVLDRITQGIGRPRYGRRSAA